MAHEVLEYIVGKQQIAKLSDYTHVHFCVTGLDMCQQLEIHLAHLLVAFSEIEIA
jgi:hypothetical protein